MQQYFRYFSKLDNIEWTEYFLNDFIPKYNFFEKKFNSGVNFVIYNEINPTIKRLSLELMLTFNFPPISHFLIFHHLKEQPIHIDGSTQVQNASLNLPISGYENTKTIFYKTNNDNVNIFVSNARYYNKKDVTPVAEIKGSNEWVLIDSSTPHQVVGIDVTKPRMTVCIRFVGNQTFQDLIKNTKL
jgi:hypothetical protein